MTDYLNSFPRPANDNRRGVHGAPGPEPKGLLSDWDSKWKSECKALNLRWMKVMSGRDETSFTFLMKLLEIGIMPVVRMYREHPNPQVINTGEMDFIKRCIKAGVFYFETNNEPDLSLEWKDNKRPDNWLDIVVNNFIFEASWVRENGGYLLFPAFGPGGRGNPFQMIVDKGRKDLLDGNCCLAIHNYCLARPLDYPNDLVTLTGHPITYEEWSSIAPDKKAGDGPIKAWEMGYETVNKFRHDLANPNASIMQDSTCFRAFEYFDKLINDACDHSIPIFTTEGGYNVWQRAGTTAGDDPRWPKPSPSEVAKMTLDMFRYMEQQAPDYYFASMPWLLACYEAGYSQQGFEMQGPWYSRIFKYDWNGCDAPNGEMPVATLLKANPTFGPPVTPPPVTPPVTPPVVVPPVSPTAKYKIKAITRTVGLPLIIFFGVASGLPGKLTHSDGTLIREFVTGNKPERGAGGTEAGYTDSLGNYVLFIGDDKFIIPMTGGSAKIEFEPVTDTPPVDPLVFLRTDKAMTRAVAEALLLKLNALYQGMFRIE